MRLSLRKKRRCAGTRQQKGNAFANWQNFIFGSLPSPLIGSGIWILIYFIKKPSGYAFLFFSSSRSYASHLLGYHAIDVLLPSRLEPSCCRNKQCSSDSYRSTPDLRSSEASILTLNESPSCWRPNQRANS